MSLLADDSTVVQRLLDHVAAGTTDRSGTTWREPVANFLSPKRLAAEVALLRRVPVVFCPSAALASPGAYLAGEAAGVALVAVRGRDGVVRTFRNACRHRGAQVAEGSGCARSFVCPYHAWTYGDDGRLRHIPSADGFPDVEADGGLGLVPVATTERHGLVIVDQSAPPAVPLALNDAWDDVPDLLTPDHRLVSTSSSDEPVNWKVFAATFLEGYHIKSLHRTTFFPVQYDNVNVVERFGPHSRLAFPYRSIERLADVPAPARSAAGKLTWVVHLFPNVMVATFPSQTLLFVLDPLEVDRTRITTFVLAEADRPALRRASVGTGRDPDFFLAGGAEDVAVARSIQRGLTSGANTHLTFGEFEGAIAHFHHTLDTALAERGSSTDSGAVAVADVATAHVSDVADIAVAVEVGSR